MIPQNLNRVCSKELGVDMHGFNVSDLPPVLPPAGLSHDRAQYLHKEVHPFVKTQFRNELCPSPTGN